MREDKITNKAPIKVLSVGISCHIKYPKITAKLMQDILMVLLSLLLKAYKI